MSHQILKTDWTLSLNFWPFYRLHFSSLRAFSNNWINAVNNLWLQNNCRVNNCSLSVFIKRKVDQSQRSPINGTPLTESRLLALLCILRFILVYNSRQRNWTYPARISTSMSCRRQRSAEFFLETFEFQLSNAWYARQFECDDENKFTFDE